MVSKADEQLPHCYSEDFVLEWNADPKNKEGLVVGAQYFGATALPDNAKGTFSVANTDIIDKGNGRAVLDNSIWEGIPDTGIVYVSLLRGSVELETVIITDFSLPGSFISLYATVIISEHNGA